MGKPVNTDVDNCKRDLGDLQSWLEPMSAVLRKSCHFSETEANALFNIGVKAYQQGKLEDASRFFAAVNLLRPMNATYLSAQGKCLKMMKDFDGAYQVFLLAWELNKQEPELALHAADSLMLAGRKEEAAQLLQDILALPEFPEMDRRLKEKAEAWSTLLALGKDNERA